MATPPSAKRRKLDFTEEYKVIVGTGADQATWTIAKNLLVKHSEFFKGACSTEWKEGQNKVIELKDIIPETFAIYIQWLYTGELIVDELEEKLAKDSIIEPSFKALINVFVLADFLRNLPLRNAVIDTIIQYNQATYKLPNLGDVERAVDRTPKDSTLARLLVDMTITAKTITEEKLAFRSSSLMSILVQRLSENHDARTFIIKPRKAEKCAYHEHDDANPKCK